MSRTSYREQDYAFGQRMLTLRMRIGLTQAGLAEVLEVSRNAVGGWEAGQSYPKAEHLKHFITLGLQQKVFAAKEEEIRMLWRAAHQKVLLDESWLYEVLQQQAPPSETPSIETSAVSKQMSVPPVSQGLRLDWGDALDVPTFYGRKEELALLSRWIVQERCHVVSVLGMGGIGKSALTTRVMHQVAEQFEVVIWRSLRDRPSCEVLINDCLQVLAPRVLAEMPTSFDRRLPVLMQQLRTQRVLVVLDNLEVLLEEGSGTGRMRPGFDEYTRLLQQMGETAHQSCLVLTSRGMPAALVPLEGRRSPVRTLRLTGLDRQAGAELLEEKDVTSSMHDRTQLVEVYQGNPLALKIVAQTIVELFGGEITPFLQQGEVIFGGVRNLLDEQFERLSALEQTMLLWFAVLREPISLPDLVTVFSIPRPMVQVLEAVEGLRRHSLIEQGQRAGSFTLQSVVLEYATARLIEEGSREIEQGRLLRLVEHGMCLAQAKEYVRQTQEQLLVAPLLTRLQGTYQGRAKLEAHLLRLLDQVRSQDQTAQGYGSANLVTLLRVQRGHLRSLNLSYLALRNVFLQGTDMQDSTLSHATMHESVFTEPFDAISVVIMSRTGHYQAIATKRGEIWVWYGDGLVLHHAWHAHTDLIWSLTFSPDERTLASTCADGSTKLWDVGSGTLLWESWLVKSPMWLAFSPDGGMIAGAGLDALVYLWDSQHGTPLKALPHASRVVYPAWSPDGRLFASGCVDGSVWLWQSQVSEPDRCIQVLAGNTRGVNALAFSPDSTRLVSAGIDGMFKLWDLTTGACLQTFSEHSSPVQVVWSPDGRTLAIGNYDATILLWDLQQDRARRGLQGHTGLVPSLVFTPDSRTLLSGSYDGTSRTWDVESGQCLRIMAGYTACLLDLDWSPDGRRLACCGADMLATLWDVTNEAPQRLLQDYRDIVQGVAWSPDGRLVASGEQDGIGLWDPITGVCLYKLRYLYGYLYADTSDPSVFQGVAWSPDGRLLAAGSYLSGVHVWDTTTRNYRWGGDAQTTRVRRVAWSSDGCLLVGGGYDSFVYVWDANDGTLRWQLVGHDGAVMSVACSPNGRRVASGGGGKEGGQLLVWELQSGKRVQTLTEPSEMVSAVIWSPSGEQLISGDSDGKSRWWQVESGQCLRMREGHEGMVQALKVSPDGSMVASCGDDGAIRLWNIDSGELLRMLRRDRPYERLNITGIRGLSQAQKASLHALGAFEETDIRG